MTEARRGEIAFLVAMCEIRAPFTRGNSGRLADAARKIVKGEQVSLTGEQTPLSDLALTHTYLKKYSGMEAPSEAELLEYVHELAKAVKRVT